MELIVNNITFQAEKIIKEDLNIIGYDINNNEIFSHKGISDFSGYVLKDNEGYIIEFPIPEPTSLVLLQDDVDEIYAQFLKTQGVEINV